MKICITAQGKDLDSFVDPRFGRCLNLLIVNSEKPKKIVKVIENQSAQAMRGAGIATAQTVAQENCKAVITGNIGPNAFMALDQAGIKVYSGNFGITVKDVVKKLNQKKLSKTLRPTVGGHFGGGPGGFGRGGSRGFGRGQGDRGFGPPNT